LCRTQSNRWMLKRMVAKRMRGREMEILQL
jgi:hypothetical protein